MQIRLMQKSDYSQTYLLWSKTAGIALFSIDDSEKGIEIFLNRNPETNFVAVIDDRIVGVIMSGHDGRRGYIYHAAVDTEYRGCGIGHTLVQKALESLRNQGINRVALVAMKSNEIGKAFWIKAGFEERKDLNYYNKILNDANSSR
jgi:ribosomal protein S18 acetylase RimI-like enzyme